MSASSGQRSVLRSKSDEQRSVSVLFAFLPIRMSSALYAAMGPVLFALMLFSFLAYWRFLESITPQPTIAAGAARGAIAAAEMDDDDFRIPFINERLLSQVETVYVIPGGGSSIGSTSGTDGTVGYPEWTRRRTEAAYAHYSRHYRTAEETSTFSAVRGSASSDTQHLVQVHRKHRNDKPKAIFLALSAGSLNSPNALYADGRIIFESTHTVKHLKELGLPKELVFGDTTSWDTVTNALVLRQTVEAILLYRRRVGSLRGGKRRREWWSSGRSVRLSTEKNINTGTVRRQFVDGTGAIVKKRETSPETLMIEVFISDFHADRVQATFEWVLGLRPQLSGFQLIINSVDSNVVTGGADVRGTQFDFSNRMEHEAEGIKRIRHNAQLIHSMPQLYAFLSLGGHQGMWKYLHEEYEKSKGSGW